MTKKEIAAKVADRQKAKVQKKVKRTLHRFLFSVLCSIFLFVAGYFLGMHHRIIRAVIRGEKDD